MAAELVEFAPDVILTSSSVATAAMLQATRTIPIVFTIVIDPVGAGYVDNLARPGGNATGFTIYEYSMSGKWLELLKAIAPGLTRAMVLRDLPWRPDPASLLQSRQWRRRSAWSCARSMRGMQARSSVPSRHSGKAQIAA